MRSVEKRKKTKSTKSKVNKTPKPVPSVNASQSASRRLFDPAPTNDPEERQTAKSTKRVTKKSSKSSKSRQSHPGPSGTACKSTSRRPIDPIPTNDTEYENEDEDDNPCCVCKKHTPPHPRRSNIEIFTWVACEVEGCPHWVHQNLSRSTAPGQHALTERTTSMGVHATETNDG